jgi:CRP-like cAMP-binding protein
VLSGRLRGYILAGEGAEGGKQLVGEYGRGDMVGIVDLITGSSLSATYLAVRFLKFFFYKDLVALCHSF